MDTQKIEYIKISELVLWTENPRDPINKNAKDQDVVDRAMEDKNSRWQLRKIAKEMGAHYDYSELPTIVFHGSTPVVYDGNRRIILGKIKHQLIKISEPNRFQVPDFPMKIPCNVCEKKIALENVLRKHGDSGSWQPLERDIFLNKHMKKKKSLFLMFEENTGLISQNPHLNQRFVKEEIITEENLNRIGFDITDKGLKSRHTSSQAMMIFTDLSNKIKTKKISTRENRGKVFEILEPSLRQIIDLNTRHKLNQIKPKFSSKILAKKVVRQTKRTRKKDGELFGGDLYLVMGPTNDLYRDLKDLYKYYITEKERVSATFLGLIRMALRLICEVAAAEVQAGSMDNYLKRNFSLAKKELDQNVKTTLSSYNVTETSIVQLLHIGAHNYQASSNKEQTLAISIVVGAILQMTLGGDVSI